MFLKEKKKIFRLLVLTLHKPKFCGLLSLLHVVHVVLPQLHVVVWWRSLLPQLLLEGLPLASPSPASCSRLPDLQLLQLKWRPADVVTLRNVRIALICVASFFI